ncbi:hypothetical protein D1AOALGA4SA_9805 [Olavius algarvensis Delta 1 endosymbiont]|nr:hypothetical protein D1AOALGA4SA_9805 [Olavius algarvensis Delta 1 endosymbiont]
MRISYIQNPKNEIRNSKQILKSKVQMFKTSEGYMSSLGEF